MKIGAGIAGYSCYEKADLIESLIIATNNWNNRSENKDELKKEWKKVWGNYLSDKNKNEQDSVCLLYTSDAADDIGQV